MMKLEAIPQLTNLLPSVAVRKENEEMYRSRQNVINVSSTVASALDGDG